MIRCILASIFLIVALLSPVLAKSRNDTSDPVHCCFVINGYRVTVDEVMANGDRVGWQAQSGTHFHDGRNLCAVLQEITNDLEPLPNGGEKPIAGCEE